MGRDDLPGFKIVGIRLAKRLERDAIHLAQDAHPVQPLGKYMPRTPGPIG